MKMAKKELGLFIFCLFLCRSVTSSLKSTVTRVKRWDNTGDMSNMFRGTAGIDYPDLKSIPNTSFRCENQILYEGGLYADVETQCQVYHVCHDGRKDSFLCGRGTIFNQQILACDYWYSADCASAPSFYYLNSNIGSSITGDWQAGHSSYTNTGQTNPAGNSYEVDSTNNKEPPALFEGHADHMNVHKDQKSCHCLQSSYKTPWSFPSGLGFGKDN